MSLRLRIEHGQDAGKTFRLPTAGVYTLGRKTDVSLRVLDMKVSGEHCEIRIGSDGSAILHDAGSTHGSLLNGQPARGKEKPLNPGDEIRLGMTIIRVLSDGDADADLQPVAGREVGETSVDTSGDQGKTKTTLPPDELVGKNLGGYQIDRKIGAGGMGGVYLAEQISLKRKVALKVLNEQFAADSAFVDQFVNEARAAGALNHPNVVQVYDVGSAEGHYYFSMEVMPGGSIEDKIKEGPVEWEEGLNWFIDSANALIFAKRREILHRDVKPDNLMIGEDDSAKLCDLGLAKKSEVSDLMDQGIIGTPHFISPEAIRRKNDIDHRTDLYSLGCTFYRIFAGKNPYPGSTVKEILLGHLNKPVPHINDHNRDIPKEIDQVVAQLMAKDPEDRIQTPEELLRILDKIRTTYNLEAHGIKPASKKPLIIVAAAAVLVIGGLATWMATRETPKQIIQLSPEEEARLLESERNNARAAVDTSKLKIDFSSLQADLATGDLKDGNNWQKRIFPELAEKFRTLATEWTAKADQWKQERGEIEDDVILGYYDAAIGDVAEISKKANKEAKDISDYIAKVKSTQAEWETKREEALAAAKNAVKTYVTKLGTLQQEGDFLGLEKSLHADEISKILKPLIEGEVAGRPLVKFDKDIKPDLDKQLPADKQGERGAKTIAMAVTMIEKGAQAKLSEAQALLANDPGHVEYRKALTLLESYQDGLPEADGMAEEAPRTSAVYIRISKDVATRIKEVQDAHALFTAQQLKHDKQLYFDLVKTLWAPKSEGGLLQRFEFVGAKAAAERAEKDAQDSRYKALVSEWLPAIQALRGTFERLVKSYPDGWTDDDYFEQDGKRTRKRKIKGISDRSIELHKETRGLADLGSAWVLENVFFLEGAPRMKTLTAEDHFGIAVLAELAIDYDLAQKHYMEAAKLYGDDPLANVVRTRIGQLGTERQAGEKWKRARDWLLAQEEKAKVFQAIVDKQAADPEAFTKEDRANVQEWYATYGKEIGFIRENVDNLKADKTLAATRWGSSLRTTPHRSVAYAGERLAADKDAAPGNGGGATKDGDKKDGDKKDGDK